MCFVCLRELLQAGITDVAYLHPWDPVEAYGAPVLGEQYAALQAHFTRFEQIDDPATDTLEPFAAVLDGQ